jgi:hypothetical protein
VRDHGGASMHLGDRAEIDGEGEFDLLALLEAERSSADEDAVGAQIDGAAQAPLASGIMMYTVVRAR